MNPKEAKSLLKKYLENRCTPEEQASVEQWYDSLVNEQSWELEGNRYLEAREQLKAKIDRRIGLVPIYKRRWLQYAAAVVLLAGCSLFWLYHKPQQTVNTPPVVAALAPGSNKATLTLANGKVITLDQEEHKQLAREENTAISQQKNGTLVYTSLDSQPSDSRTFNVLNTPKGGQYKLVLPDGTKVWLNAMSSIRFPVSFPAGSRNVSVTGEAYFEVAQLHNKPFKVTANNTSVEVLGTKFNISAYSNDEEQKITLLQGKIKISSQNSLTLLPGQQAVSKTSNEPQAITLTAHADTEQAIAWMNGYFQFRQAGIREVMQQITRWYDIEVVFAGAVPTKKFSGEIPRSSSLSEVLTGLSVSGINYRTEGRKVIIMP
jgi:ferric-dicitrate binding protein FerR (iron transport regulator)